jgi:hypothetical protein
MGLFSRNKSTPSSAPAAVEMQPPDELAQRGGVAYEGSDFTYAAELYGDAVDKLHTMYVMGGARYRKPSDSDRPILDGLVNSVGAAIASGRIADVRHHAERACHYLAEIDQMVPPQASGPSIYRQAIDNVSFELRK